MNITPLRLAVVVLTMLLGAGCAGTPRRAIFPKDEPPRSLTVAQIMLRFTRDTLVQRGDKDYKTLLASGIADAEITDGTLAVGRINCCHEPLERANMLAFYLPSALGAEVGDFVEVRLGRSPAKEDDPGEANQATQLVQKRDASGPCRWEPPQQGVMRAHGSVIYCDWMRQQGWVAEGTAPSIYKSWIKKP
jgi:hypothetical protein